MKTTENVIFFCMRNYYKTDFSTEIRDSEIFIIYKSKKWQRYLEIIYLSRIQGQTLTCSSENLSH